MRQSSRFLRQRARRLRRSTAKSEFWPRGFCIETRILQSGGQMQVCHAKQRRGCASEVNVTLILEWSTWRWMLRLSIGTLYCLGWWWLCLMDGQSASVTSGQLSSTVCSLLGGYFSVNPQEESLVYDPGNWWRSWREFLAWPHRQNFGGWSYPQICLASPSNAMGFSTPSSRMKSILVRSVLWITIRMRSLDWSSPMWTTWWSWLRRTWW